MKLTKRDIEQLSHFAAGNFNVPKGMGGVAITNFIQRGWIVRIESPPDNVAPRYRLESKGLAAFQAILISN
jgi:hypothetical protein